MGARRDGRSSSERSASMRSRALLGGLVGTLMLAAIAAVAPAALAARPTRGVPVATNSMDAVTGAHQQITFPVQCPAGSLVVGGGAYLRNALSAATIPTNGLVLFGSLPSDTAGAALANGAVSPTSWTDIAGYS